MPTLRKTLWVLEPDGRRWCLGYSRSLVVLLVAARLRRLSGRCWVEADSAASRFAPRLVV